MAALQETSSHTKKIRNCDYAEVDKTVFQWFSLQRSQHVPTDGTMIKWKALFCVISTAPVITDDDILEQFQKDHSPESDEEDGCDDESLNDEVPERPSRSEVESALDVLKNASLFSNTGGVMQCVIFKFETCLQRNA